MIPEGAGILSPIFRQDCPADSGGVWNGTSLAICAFLLACLCQPGWAQQEGEFESGLTIAVATSAFPALEEIARRFGEETGTEIEISAGSSGILLRQAEEGAPFDVFIAADMERVELLAAQGIVEPGTVRPYARGEVVLWQPSDTTSPLQTLMDLGLEEHQERRLALAHPGHAPYGQAAWQILERSGLLESVGERIVYGESVRQALQYAETGNVDAAFAARSLLTPGKGRTIEIPEELYDPVLQGCGVMAGSSRLDLARRFQDYLLGPEGQMVLLQFGFLPPPDYSLRTPSPRERPLRIDWRPVLISLRVGFLATAIAVVLGSLIGYFLANRAFPGRRFVEAFVLLPLVLPPTVLGYYLLVIIGRESPIGEVWEAVFGSPLVFTLRAAVIAASASTIPIVARQLTAAFAGVDPDVTEAARIDGAHGWNLLFHVHLPQIRLPLIAAGTIAFARAIGDFGATLMVAGNLPGKTQTAAIAIYDLINIGREREALVLVILISVVSVVVLAFTTGRRTLER